MGGKTRSNRTGWGPVPGLTERRTSAWSVALAVAAIATACGDSTSLEVTDSLVSAVVTGPTQVSAAVIDFTAVSQVEVEGGDVFTSAEEGGRLRAIIVLYDPGDIRLSLTPTSADVTPTASLVEVADASYEPASPEAYDVRVGS